MSRQHHPSARLLILVPMLAGFESSGQVTFSDQAQALGIYHTFDGTAVGGAGVSFCDFNGDGWDDLTICTGEGTQLAFYKNVNGSFQLLPPPIDNTQEVKQVLWVDFDNDADKDIYACAFDGVSRLYRNNGNFTFTDITAAAKLRLEVMNVYASAWGDYDNDGWLDLYTTAYSLGYGDTFTNYLYRNLGDGTFEDVTNIAEVADTISFTFLPVFLDYDNDNRLDIYTIVDRYMPNVMFHNNGNGTFTNTTASTGTGLPPIDAMCGAVGDFDNNGYQDIYVTNSPDGNKLLKNNGNNTFTEMAVPAGVAMYSSCWGSQFLDGDNDMDEDLYVSGDFPGTLYNSSAYYRNNGNNTFTEPPGIGFDADTFRSYSNAIGDVNNDGYTDIAVLNATPDSFNLWVSSGGTDKWLRFALTGTQSNRDAIGARIEVWEGGLRQIRMIHCGLGYLGQNSLRPIVGLGSNTSADSVKVTWPSGHVQRLFNVAANQTVLIVESIQTTYTDITGWQDQLHTYDTDFSQLGGGVSFVDFDNDGLDDITLATGAGQGVWFYKSWADSLEKVDLLPANSDTAEKKSVLWGDYDNDGKLDVYISTYQGQNKLFKNNGTSFADVTLFALPPQGTMASHGACWLDFDLDGNLDLYVVNRSNPPFLNLRNYLYRNNGNGTFTDVSYPAGVADSNNMPQGVAAVDYDNDSWPDIFIAIDKHFGNKLFKNNGDGTFTDVSAQTGTDFEMDGMCVAQGDADNDGDLEMYVTNSASTGNVFFRNNGNGTFDTLHNGTAVHKVGWGGDFLDYDNDGYLDLFTVNSWNALDTNYRSFLLRNNGDMSYTDMRNVGVDADSLGLSYGTAFGDLNDDGFPDLAVNNEYGTVSRIYLNNGMWNNWVKFNLEGTVSNRNAVGTWLRVVSGGDSYYRYTSAGISYISQNSFTEMVGLSDHTWIDTVEVKWPNGHVDVITGVGVNQTVTLKEGMTVPVNPQIVILGTPPFCQGDVVTLDAGEWESYAWSNGATTRYTSVTAGDTYSVTVTNVFGFNGSGTIMVTINPNPQITLTPTMVDCFGTSTGEVQSAVIDGTSPYQHHWSTGATTSGITNLAPGNYALTVTDALGCQSNASTTVTQPTAISASATSFDPTCPGGSDGSLNMTVTGGTAPYTYLWDHGSAFEDPAGLSAGCYIVTVEDANNCALVDTFCVDEPAPIELAFDITPVACVTGTQGTIDMSVTGGNGGYTFLWSNNETTEDIDSLPSGFYTVTVTDQHACVVSATVEVETSSPIQVSAVSSDVPCHAGSNGTINITVSGGISPYTFAWTTGQSTEDIGALTAGSYRVTVMDSVGCKKTLDVTVQEPDSISINALITGVSCHGLSDGSIQAVTAGGSGGYDYLWSTQATTSTIANLAVGTYVLTVTDSAGCHNAASFFMPQPNPLTANAIVTDVLCFGQSNGEIALTISGGTAPFGFTWSNNDSTQTLPGLAAGSYAVTVEDDHGCTASLLSIQVSQPAEISCSLNITNANCYAEASGALDLTISGGTLPYDIMWSTGDTSEDMLSVLAGQYIVTVTDAHGCFDVLLGNVGQPTAITSSLIADSVSCFGYADGTIQTWVSGGSPGYSFLWSDQSVLQDRSNLATGIHSVVITDQHGCEHLDSVVIYQPEVLVAQGTSIPDTSNLSVGSATAIVGGGTVPYTYQWDDPQQQTTQVAVGLSAGVYEVTVRDANDCTDTAQVEVTLVLGIDVPSLPHVVIFPNPTDEWLTIMSTGMAINELTIRDGTGRQVGYPIVPRMNPFTISTAHLPSGMYGILARFPSGGTRMLKFVVLR